jgi:uncharacterized integral membrane protein
MFRWLLALLLIASALLGVAIGLFNPQSVEFDLIFWAWQAPLGAVVVAALVSGVLLGLVVFWLGFAAPAGWSRWRRKHRTANK